MVLQDSHATILVKFGTVFIMFFIYHLLYFNYIYIYVVPKKQKNERKKNKKSVPSIGMEGTKKKNLKKKRLITSACDRLTRVRQRLIPVI